MRIFEKQEIAKLLEYYFPDLNPSLKVKAKIIKYDENLYGVEISHFCKRIGDAEYYRPGWGATSVEQAENRLDLYMNDFTNDYIDNANF